MYYDVYVNTAKKFEILSAEYLLDFVKTQRYTGLRKINRGAYLVG